MLGVASAIVISYIISSDWPEIFNKGEEVFKLLYDISLAYIVSYLFYLITVRIPAKVEEEKNIKFVSELIKNIVNDIITIEGPIKIIDYLLANKDYKKEEYSDLPHITNEKDGEIKPVETLNNYCNHMNNWRIRNLTNLNQLDEFNKHYLKNEKLSIILHAIEKETLCYGDIIIPKISSIQDYRNNNMTIRIRNSNYKMLIDRLLKLKDSNWYRQ